MKIYIYLITLLLSTNLLVSNTCIDESKLLYKEGNYKSSIIKLESCIDYFINQRDKELLSEAYFGLASNYIVLGTLDSALKYYLLSEKLLKTSTRQKFYSKVLNDLSVCYIRIGLNQKATYFLKKCVEINIKNNDTKKLTHNYINLGHAALKLNKFDSAIEYYNLALETSDRNDSDNISNILSNLGVVFSRKGDYIKAINYTNEVVNKLPNKSTSVDNLLYKTNLDLYLIANKDSLEEETKFLEYLNLSKESDNNYYADANFKFAIYSLYKNDFKTAFQHLNHSNSIYIENRNYIEAIGNSKYFKNVVNVLDIKSNFEPQKLLFELRTAEANLYSNELEKEFLTLEKIDKTIIDLNKEVKFAWLSVEFLFVIIFFLIIMIPISIRYIITRKILQKLKTTLNQFNEDIEMIHIKDVQNNIAKMSNIMLMSNRFSDEDIFIKAIEDIQKGSNKLSLQLNYYKQINRSIYVNTKSTDKLQLDK